MSVIAAERVSNSTHEEVHSEERSEGDAAVHAQGYRHGQGNASRHGQVHAQGHDEAFGITHARVHFEVDVEQSAAQVAVGANATSLERRLQQRLVAVRQQGLWRAPRVREGLQRPVCQIDGQTLLAFCSNDYLGLAGDPRVAVALREGSEHYGVGAGAAHLINGHTRAHAELEEALAVFTGRARALLFSTGYMANLGVLQALLGRHDRVFEDRLNHASLLDAVRMVGCRRVRYRHLDSDDLEQRLREAPTTGERLIATDGVFSMDGDVAALPVLAALAQRHNAWLMLDDAHALGVLGPAGSGSCGHFGVSANAVPVLMGTLGKALGTAGAFVAGSEVLIQALQQWARSYIYTTAMPGALAVAALAALRLAQTEDWRRERLQQRILQLRQGLRELGLPLPPGETPIQPLWVGSSAKAVALASGLQQRGILVPAIRPPTVPDGSARLRITLSALHAASEVDRLINVLAELLPPDFTS